MTVYYDHSSGEFGSERLVQQVVDSIMHATERTLEQVPGHHPPTPEEEKSNPFDKETGECEAAVHIILSQVY